MQRECKWSMQTQCQRTCFEKAMENSIKMKRSGAKGSNLHQMRMTQIHFYFLCCASLLSTQCLLMMFLFHVVHGFVCACVCVCVCLAVAKAGDVEFPDPVHSGLHPQPPLSSLSSDHPTHYQVSQKGLQVSPSIHPSIHPFIHPSIHPSIHPYTHPFSYSLIWSYSAGHPCSTD